MSTSRLTACLAALTIAFAVTLTNTAKALEIPDLNAPVMDTAGTLDRRTKKGLDDALRALKNRTGVQIAALIVPSLEGLTIEEAGIKVADRWKIGGSRDDRGAILLVAMTEKKVRIEVGQGLEGDLPDALAKRIISERIVPLMREGDMAGGVTVGVFSIAQAALPGEDVSTYFGNVGGTHRQQVGRPQSLSLWQLLAFVIFFFFVVFTRIGRRMMYYSGNRNYYGGSSFPGLGGGGYSGGGGKFSGGGASGGW